MERDYKDELRQAYSYISKIERSEGYKRPLEDDEYTEDLKAFEKAAVEVGPYAEGI